jgi:pyruvate kinase
MRKTQIVATIGPVTESEEMIASLIQAGANVLRFNTKHNVPEWHRQVMERVRHVSQRINAPVQLLLDLQGPEVRITLPHIESFPVQQGENVTFTSDAHTLDQHSVLIPQDVIESLNVGNEILLSGGACEFVVTGKTANTVTAISRLNCTVATRKTMNTPEIVLNMPSLLAKDLSYIEATADLGVEYIGLSFVRNREDIQHLRDELKQRNVQTKVVAKIENRAAINNLDEIIAVSDLLMVARGDLGVEIPFWEVPYWQKEMIRRCRNLYKPVITATQMLLSMTNFPRPTRAEVSDVANAVLDGTSFVMLSEETSAGNYPIKAVETQAKICEYYDQFTP